MQLYLRVAERRGWPAGYAGVDGLVTRIAQSGDALHSPLADERRLYVTDDEPLPGHAAPAGYDAAHVDAWGNVYSLIVHYLLGNRPAGSAGFVLNEQRLLPSRADAERLIAEWTAWDPAPGEKETLDNGESVRPLAIYPLDITA